MKVLLLISTLFSFDMIYLSESAREPYYFFHKNYSDFYSYSYHYGNDGSGHNPVQHTPDVSTNAPSPKHQRSYSFQNEKRNAESHHQPPPVDIEDDFEDYDDNSRGAIIYPSNHDNFQRPESDNLSGGNCTFNLCENVEDYPVQYIKDLFDKTRVYDAFFNATPVILGNRFGSQDYNNICRSSSSIIYPRSAINKNQVKRYIPNYEKYRQGVRVETCEGKGKPCQFSELLPLGYETKCEQRHDEVVLLALNDDRNPVIETFSSPSCCVCTFRKTLS